MESFFLNYGWVVITGALATCYCYIVPSLASRYTQWRSDRRRPILEAEAHVLEANGVCNDMPRQRTSEIPVTAAHELNSTTTSSSRQDSEMKDGYESSSDSSSLSPSVRSDSSNYNMDYYEHRGEQQRRKRKDVSRYSHDGQLVEARRVGSSQQITTHPSFEDGISPPTPPHPSPVVEVINAFVVEEAVEASSQEAHRLRNARFLRNAR